MLIGIHVSAAGGLAKAPERAAAAGAEVFQFFSRSPRGGPAAKITPATAADFKAACAKYGQAESYIHTPYYINFASANPRIYHGSIDVVRQELERGSLLGVKYVITHLGSSLEQGRKAGLAQTTQGLQECLAGYRGTTKLLIEIAAGTGQIMGDTFEEIKAVLKGVKQPPVGVCFDTAHAFASGYDLRTPAAVAATLAKFDKIISLKYLKLIHGNDSKTDFNARRDRHEHIGLGKIGLPGFKALLSHPKLQKINFSLETPEDEVRQDADNVKVMKQLRNRYAPRHRQ